MNCRPSGRGLGRVLLAVWVCVQAVWAEGLLAQANPPAITSGVVASPYFERVKRQAEAGDVKAQLRLGDLYRASSDFTNAAVWYLKAAEKGEVDAQLSLSTLYLSGKGVARDAKEANRWLRTATERMNEQKGLASASVPPPNTPQARTETPAPSPDSVAALAPVTGAPVPALPSSALARVTQFERVKPQIQSINLVHKPY